MRKCDVCSLVPPARISIGIIPEITCAASLETVLNPLATLSAICRPTGYIRLWHSCSSSAFSHIAIPYVSIDVATDARRDRRLGLGPPIFGIRRDRAQTTADALLLACLT